MLSVILHEQIHRKRKTSIWLRGTSPSRANNLALSGFALRDIDFAARKKSLIDRVLESAGPGVCDICGNGSIGIDNGRIPFGTIDISRGKPSHRSGRSVHIPVVQPRARRPSRGALEPFKRLIIVVLTSGWCIDATDSYFPEKVKNGPG
jgi:hypothetical protein